MEKFKLVEKKNHLHVHGLFYSRERADKFLSEVVPSYVSRGFYDDKTLKPEDFEVIGG